MVPIELFWTTAIVPARCGRYRIRDAAMPVAAQAMARAWPGHRRPVPALRSSRAAARLPCSPGSGSTCRSRHLRRMLPRLLPAPVRRDPKQGGASPESSRTCCHCPKHPFLAPRAPSSAFGRRDFAHAVLWRGRRRWAGRGRRMRIGVSIPAATGDNSVMNI